MMECEDDGVDSRSRIHKMIQDSVGSQRQSHQMHDGVGWWVSLLARL